MKASELRIGNIIKLGGNTIDTYQTYKPTPITSMGIHSLFVENTERPDAVLSVFQPVELTEEWLLKFGFTKCKVLEMYPDGFILEDIQGSTFYLRPSYEGGYYWGFYTPFHEECELYSCKPIKKVHDLQNLIFALSGTELTIK